MVTIAEEDQIVMIQAQDEAIKSKIAILRKPVQDRTRGENCAVHQYALRDGVLFIELTMIK